MDPSNIYEVGLVRGPCFGRCPIFRFTASRQYGYAYDGEGYVEPLGRRAGRFPDYLFDRLAEVCVELRVLELDDVYPCVFDDASLLLVTVRHAGGTKTVRDEGSGATPVRRWAFAALVEVVIREAFAIEDRTRRK